VIDERLVLFLESLLLTINMASPFRGRVTPPPSSQDLENASDSSAPHMKPNSPHTPRSYSSMTPRSSAGSIEPRPGENVSVAVRVRPLSDSEINSNQPDIWDVVSGENGKVILNDEWREKMRKIAGASDYQFGMGRCCRALGSFGSSISSPVAGR
jgi:hypothetical protein